MSPKPNCVFTVEAEVDPQVPGRVLAWFTQRGTLPQSFNVDRSGNRLLICMHVDGLDVDATELLARKLRNIPTVLDVSRSWLGRPARE